MGGSYVLRVLFWKNVEKYGNTVVFPGGYGHIGEIQHGQLYGRIGDYRVNQ